MKCWLFGLLLCTVLLVAQNGGRHLVEYESDWFRLRGASDPTKRIKFQVDGVTTGTTREITVPDANFTLVGALTSEVASSAIVAQAGATLEWW